MSSVDYLPVLCKSRITLTKSKEDYYDLQQYLTYVIMNELLQTAWYNIWIVNFPTLFLRVSEEMWVQNRASFADFCIILPTFTTFTVSSPAGLQHGGQTGSEGCAHRPEWNSSYRRHSSAWGAGSPKQVGNSPQTRERHTIKHLLGLLHR